MAAVENATTARAQVWSNLHRYLDGLEHHIDDPWALPQHRREVILRNCWYAAAPNERPHSIQTPADVIMPACDETQFTAALKGYHDQLAKLERV